MFCLVARLLWFAVVFTGSVLVIIKICSCRRLSSLGPSHCSHLGEWSFCFKCWCWLCENATLLSLMMLLLLRTQTPNKVLPPRPPLAKTGPGRPPPPKLKTTGRSVSAPASASKPKPQVQKPHRKGLVLPPRPNPGHRLYNNYTVREIPLAHLRAGITCQIPAQWHFTFCILCSTSLSFPMESHPWTIMGATQENCHFRWLNS